MLTYRTRHELPAFNLVLDWFEDACRRWGLHAGGRPARCLPANVLVGADERVRLAPAAAAAPPSPRPGFHSRRRGGRRYLAPEQPTAAASIAGRHLQPGVTFYELLTLVFR